MAARRHVSVGMGGHLTPARKGVDVHVASVKENYIGRNRFDDFDYV